MTDKKTGGPAFPMQDGQAIHAYAQARVELLMSGKTGATMNSAERDAEYIQARAEAIGGMTQRQYLAGKAMQAAISGHFAHYGHESSYWAPRDIATYAYEVADAMLEAGNA